MFSLPLLKWSVCRNAPDSTAERKASGEKKNQRFHLDYSCLLQFLALVVRAAKGQVEKKSKSRRENVRKNVVWIYVSTKSTDIAMHH